MRWELIHRADSAKSTPIPRSQAMSWYCDGALWLFSGLENVENSTLLDDLWRFDTATRTWSQPQANEARGAMNPAGRLSAATWVDGTRLFMYGGAIGAELLDDRWYFDVRTNRWSKDDAGGPGPGSRVGSAAWYDGDDRVWLFGGIGSDRGGCVTTMGDLWSYSVRLRTWQLLGDDLQGEKLPPPLSHSSTCVTPERCWLFDGFAPFAQGEASKELWAFDKRTGKAANYSLIEQGAECDRPHGRIGAAIFSDHTSLIYVFGGFANGRRPSHLNDLWMFEPTSRRWARLENRDAKEPWPSPRSSSCAWSDDLGQKWLFGGYGDTPNGNIGSLGDLWLLTV